MLLEFKEIYAEELEQIYCLMKELRSDLSLENFIQIYNQARATSHYTLTGAFLNNICVALMGYRILYDYVHGKHLYIDDLVTTASHRSLGIGAQLLKFAEQEAAQTGCAGLRLCTGIEHEAGKKFYEREGWQLRAVAFKKKV